MKWGLLVLLLGIWFRAGGAVPAPAFDSANRLYEQGKYAEAATAYQKLLESGQVSPAVYFNLGNAFFKAGQLGRAIAAYRDAAQLAPRDPDLQANLRFARNQVQGPTLAAARWQLWLGSLTLNEWTWASMAAVWLFFLLLAVIQWAKRPALRRFTLITGMVAFLLSGAFALALHQARSSPCAIIVTRDAVVRQGPLDEAQTAFVAHDGAELSVLDHKDNWLQVSVDPRRFGWVRRDEVVFSSEGTF